MVQDQRESSGSARDAVNDLIEAGLLDRLMDRVDGDGLQLTGEGGFLPEMIKAVLERGLQAELTDHLGYEKGDPAGRGSSNSRNGSTAKTLATEVGDVPLATPRDRNGSFEPRLVPKGARRAGGLDEMIISLYAGGMTVRDIQHHLARTLGTDLSHDTISKITDSVLEEVKAWQSRPLEERRIPAVVANRAGRRVVPRYAPNKGSVRRVMGREAGWCASLSVGDRLSRGRPRSGEADVQ